MSLLTVRHITVYRYREPVGLGEHRMMFRPRESHDLRLIGASLNITPQPAHLRWLLDHFETSLPEYPLEEYAQSYPFRYSDEDFPNLMRALAHHYPAADVSKWALQFLDPADTTPTMKILRSMTHGIRDQIVYTRRVEKGVQTPAETLKSQKGSCRDFDVLMMEAARSLGSAARFVSGYIYTPPRGDP